jgi:predicted nucleic acid-binding protein
MELIIDANIFMAALISSKGKTRDLLFKDNLVLFAPEYLLKEFEKYRNYIIKKSGLSKEDFNLALNLVSSRVNFIPFSEFKQFIARSDKISPDPDDTEYFALALKLGFPIWSNDKLLKKQNVIRVYSTADLLKRVNI